MVSSTHAAVVTAHRLAHVKHGGRSSSSYSEGYYPQRTESNGSKESGLRSESVPLKRSVFSQESILAGEKTLAIQKIKNGSLDDLTLKDVQLLLNLIEEGTAEMGINNKTVRQFLVEVLDSPCADLEVEAIFNLTDLNNDGKVSAEELYCGLTCGPVKRHLQQLRQEDQARRRFDEMTGLTAEVSRDLLFHRIHWRVNRDDAFRTLPFSLCYFLVFVFVVEYHLRIWDRHRVERGLEAWITNFGKDLTGPFLQHHVADPASMGTWLQDSGLAAIFGECTENHAGEPWCRLADRNVVIGDVELGQERKDGGRTSEWLLHDSHEVRADLAAKPQDFLGASARRVKQIWDTGWADEETKEIKLSFSTYNRRKHMLAVTEVIACFGGCVAAPRVVSSAVPVDPYPKKAVYGLDALYCCFLLIPLYQELKDMITTCRLQGLIEGAVTYWGFWNLVDWLSILIGLTGLCVWILCCISLQSPVLLSLLDEDIATRKLVVNVMQLDVHTVSHVKDEIGRVIWLFFCLHLLMAANIVTIMLKFLKAFQANPRLQLVTQTFAVAADDMFHWGVVFGFVFIGFSLSGNILFGGDLQQFDSFGRSLNTSFRTLMGEFEWYVETTDSDLPLGSGMPVEFLGLWFWGFMVLVMLILLNMLMAIILEHYANLVKDVRDKDVPSIFTQAWGYVQQSRNEKGFIPLSSVLALLEDEDEPAHPDTTVSTESLMKAFTMKDDQADLLMGWLRREAVQRQKKEQCGGNIASARLEAVEGLVEAMFSQMRTVCLDVSTLAAGMSSRKGAKKHKAFAAPAESVMGAKPSRDSTLRRRSLQGVSNPEGSPKSVGGDSSSRSESVKHKHDDDESSLVYEMPRNPHRKKSGWGKALEDSSVGLSQDISTLASELRFMATMLPQPQARQPETPQPRVSERRRRPEGIPPLPIGSACRRHSAPPMRSDPET